MSDEDIFSTLAYTKSPKFCKRTTFQEELQEALYARATRQQTAEYAEDFESDDDESEEESPKIVGNISKKSVAFSKPLSKYNHWSGKAQNSENTGDLSSSDENERSQCVSKLEGEVIKEEKQDVPFTLNEHSESEGENTIEKSVPFETSLQEKYPIEKNIADDLMLAEDEERLKKKIIPEKKHPRKEVQEDDSVDEKWAGFVGNNQQKEANVFPFQLGREDMVQHKTKFKPVPKPRGFKLKAASASAENISIPALSDYSKSSQSRNILSRNSHVEDHEGVKGEDRGSYSHRYVSLSAPSSETRLNDQVMKSEKRALSESPGAEGPWLASSSLVPIHCSSVGEKTGNSNVPIAGEEPSLKDNQEKTTGDCNDLKFPESGRKSPSVIELMMATLYENTTKLNKSTEDYLEEKKAFEDATTINGSNEATKDDKLEQKVALNTSKAPMSTSKKSVKEASEEKEGITQKAISSVSRSLSSTYLKKPGKPSLIPTSTSSQYLGTLKFLDNKHLKKYSAELDKADSLRASVYQEWLEKKRIFLLELQRIKRNKAESLRDKNEKEEAAKREEALASFEAWKALKEKEAKKLAEKKRLEEEKKREEIELNEKKREEAQKAFEKWKEKKAEYLKQQLKREQRVERLKKKKEEEIIAEKKEENKSAVEKWNEKKEEFMKQKKKEKMQEKKKEVEHEVEKDEKDQKAIEAYEKWLEQPFPQRHVSPAQNKQKVASQAAQKKKELDEVIQSKQKKLHVIFEDEVLPPWSPPGKSLSTRSY